MTSEITINLPSEEELAEMIKEAVNNNNDVDGVWWIGAARQILTELLDAKLGRL